MEKIWIITSICVFDTNECSPVIAFKNEEDARKELQAYKKKLRKDWVEELKNNEVTYEEGKDWARIYTYSWPQQLHAVKLVCVDLK